jgi:hydrogenase nickel incorporation protein HypA/HybF
MHEMALMESLVELVEQAAFDHQATRVTLVRVELGALSQVDAAALRFCFDAVARGACCEGARFDIVPIAGAGWCLDCGREVPLAERFGACPECGRHHVQMTRGDEFRLLELEAA